MGRFYENESHQQCQLGIDKAEGASALVPGATTSGGWGDGQLTTSGKMMREGWPANGGPPSPPPPTLTCPVLATSLTTITVEAECYLWMQGVQTEDTSNVGIGKNVGYIDTDDWMSYPEVTIPSNMGIQGGMLCCLRKQWWQSAA